MSFLRNKSGIILTEVLMAIALLAFSAVIFGSVVRDTIANNIYARNYAIAQNLAEEGVEVVYSVRDTNRMLYADEPDCWLMSWPSLGCTPSNKLSIDLYYIPIKEDGVWNLEDSGGGQGEFLDLSNTEIDNSVFQIFEVNGVLENSTGGGTDPGNFFRSIEFLEANNESATLQVRVQWKEGTKVREVLRQVQIYNY